MKNDIFNEIANVLLHYESSSGKLLQDILKKEMHYTEIFDVVERIILELEKNYDIKLKEK